MTAGRSHEIGARGPEDSAAHATRTEVNHDGADAGSSPAAGASASMLLGRVDPVFAQRMLRSLHARAGNASVVGLVRPRSRPAPAVQRHFPTGSNPTSKLENVGKEAPAASAAPTGAAKTGAMYPPTPDDAATRLPIIAVDLVTRKFGTTKTIVPYRVNVMPKAQVQEQYARVCNARGALKTNADGTTRPWTAADASGIWGFAAPEEGAYYASTESSILAHVHELLHLNSADVRTPLGSDIEEGITDYLALQVVNETSYGHGGAGYIAQMGIVHKIIGMVGAGTVQAAYFGNPGLFITAFESLKGEGSFAQLRAAMTAGNQQQIDLILGDVTLEKKIAEINNLIGGFFSWVTDEEVERVISLVNSAEDPTEKAHLQAAVRANISGLGDQSQRDRLRIGCNLM